jgi:hypothetical protein
MEIMLMPYIYVRNENSQKERNEWTNADVCQTCSLEALSGNKIMEKDTD